MSKSIFVVISSPSGGGKDTIIAKLMNIFSGSVKLLTTTTRDKRPGDVSGINYNFISKESFEKKIKNNELVEYNNFNGNYYGIEKEILAKTLANNRLVFTNIDVNGRANLKKSGVDHLSIFLLPDSIDVLENRIRERGGVEESELKKRLKIAKKEIKMANKYDYKVVNKEGYLDMAVKEIEKIINKVDKK
ncbi:MAG: guanylate kinase [Candidatus Magasanikbacteria bacterium RIFCSPHIGHO2_01_FULL_33_34]|uniref:Guanylate kinase n=1 Tax=Candidatus Magasanikbacteria bacterium RIFCSPHIGHO2_01_FULL_33_34 TaxID=1798671 RepID=A0A1F6LJL8_9BACT|nr:MAG: guanylate kinase [Candidatus Magasanikbacteria bacterium RIFCSPHIGHO2_01_FULL_33_34]OGH65514.1 MAG: guanylate kinase [Candidatus Magasanikbacteria bacterium RIFCSPHIGHO2_02_FULL_33_17]OGH76224.1 MAG: guanylate kinase [Candidatus Magasanikbacteria bacterium RIFCSPLOWO2_01_FULL_33_34]OGH81630.1 MAG: guanylate kinase [Candidatus Magasanikbacteria bacterium RIFCSPLOWO2_12_FULL_34_7]